MPGGQEDSNPWTGTNALSSKAYHSNGYQAVKGIFTRYASNATMPANTPAAPSTTSDPLICIGPFALFVLAAVVVASLLDWPVELVMNPLSLADAVLVDWGVTVPLRMVTPVAGSSEEGAVMSAVVWLNIVTCPSLSVETCPEKGVRDRSFTSDSTTPPSTSSACNRYPVPQFCIVFAGSVNEPEDVSSADASVCSVLRPFGSVWSTQRSKVAGSEESDVHLISIRCVGSIAAPGVGEVMVRAATPEERMATLPRTEIECRIRDRRRPL